MKMNCEQVQPNLLDYSNGALSSPEKSKIKAHLETCEACRAVLQGEQAIAARLSQFPAEEPLNDVWALVRARTKPRQSILPGWVTGINVWYRRAAATALAVGVIAAGVASFHQSAQKPDSGITEAKGPSAVLVQWTDDPLDHKNDVMMSYLSNM